LSPPDVRPMELAVLPLPASSILTGIKFRPRMPFHVKGFASTEYFLRVLELDTAL